MNSKAVVFQPSIFGPSVERRKIMETIQAMSTISKQVANLHLETPARATTFPRFRELPAELRKTIWEYALMLPQVHRVAEYYVHGGRFFQHSMTPIRYNPGLRTVCFEAREEAMKV
jgi:hypothetical protein